METRLLRYFAAVAREGSVTRAARSLHISQPSLSKQLMELEHETGRQLLIRGKRGVTLTPEGVLLRKRAEEILALIDKTQRELQTPSAVGGEVTIGGYPSPSVLAAAAALRHEHPQVRFWFYNGDAVDVKERLEHGGLDFAVLLEPIDAGRYEYRPLSDTAQWGLLMRSDCPLAKKDVVRHEDVADVPLVLHQRVGLQRLFTHWAQTQIDALNVAATYNVTHGSIENFARSGLGCCVTARQTMPSRMGDDVCFRPFEPPLEVSYALVHKRGAALSEAAAAFLRALKTLEKSKEAEKE